jgi:2C-methyl-D-erythritol 2,4-cyclodiphosphate synthase
LKNLPIVDQIKKIKLQLIINQVRIIQKVEWLELLVEWLELLVVQIVEAVAQLLKQHPIKVINILLKVINQHQEQRNKREQLRKDISKKCVTEKFEIKCCIFNV